MSSVTAHEAAEQDERRLVVIAHFLNRPRLVWATHTHMHGVRSCTVGSRGLLLPTYAQLVLALCYASVPLERIPCGSPEDPPGVRA